MELFHVTDRTFFCWKSLETLSVCLFSHISKHLWTEQVANLFFSDNWRARCKNSLSDDFGPTFTKPPNFLLSYNVTVAKWIVLCSQHIVLVIWIEFPPKLYQVTLLLARKVKRPKCQEIPIISAGGKKQFCCCPWYMWLKKKKKKKLDLQQWITQTGKAVPETFYTPKWQILFYR